jgi:outer membrane protein OmpA-like peptidoglycan-associated protein
MKSVYALCLGLVLMAGVALADRTASRPAPHTDPEAPGYSWPAIDLDRDGVFDRVDHCPGTRAGVEVDQCGCPMSEATPRTIRPVADYPPGVGSPYRIDLLRHGRIRLDMAFFRTDRAELRPAARRALRQVAEVIRAYPTLKFEVSGHADSRGSEAHNRELSLRRAREVRRFLIEEQGVRDIQLVARGYGESRLATAERDGFEYQANRRVELRCVNLEAMPRGSKVEARGARESLAAQLGTSEPDRLLARR